MKKFIALLILTIFVTLPIMTYSSEINQVVPPKWEDYVPDKYLNPRNDYSKKDSIVQLSIGVFLTELIVTSPIGIPMICKGTTKLKNLGYYSKKERFYKGLAEAENISNPEEKQVYYNNLLKQCRMTEKQKQKLAKKRAKKNKK